MQIRTRSALKAESQLLRMTVLLNEHALLQSLSIAHNIKSVSLDLENTKEKFK